MERVHPRAAPPRRGRQAAVLGAFAASMALSGAATADTIYDPGVAPAANSASGVTFGTHLVAGPHASVPGVGGSGLDGAAGSALDGQRTYIYDLGGQADLDDHTSNREDPGFAMMIWDMGQAYDSLRLYTHQDHYNGGPISTDFVAQDVMEYSVWGSSDGDHFSLLSDVIGYNINGGGPGLPTYTFFGTAPSVVYRGGSSEFGVLNAYTREYVFANAYRYFGIRASSVSIAQQDADPELDTIGAFNISTRPPGTPGTVPPDGTVPEPATLALAGVALAAALLRRRRD